MGENTPRQRKPRCRGETTHVPIRSLSRPQRSADPSITGRANGASRRLREGLAGREEIERQIRLVEDLANGYRASSIGEPCSALKPRAGRRGPSGAEARDSGLGSCSPQLPPTARPVASRARAQSPPELPGPPRQHARAAVSRSCADAARRLVCEVGRRPCPNSIRYTRAPERAPRLDAAVRHLLEQRPRPRTRSPTAPSRPTGVAPTACG
jgi:hypothetical protein